MQTLAQKSNLFYHLKLCSSGQIGVFLVHHLQASQSMMDDSLNNRISGFTLSSILQFLHVYQHYTTPKVVRRTQEKFVSEKPNTSDFQTSPSPIFMPINQIESAVYCFCKFTEFASEQNSRFMTNKNTHSIIYFTNVIIYVIASRELNFYINIVTKQFFIHCEICRVTIVSIFLQHSPNLYFPGIEMYCNFRTIS